MYIYVLYIILLTKNVGFSDRLVTRPNLRPRQGAFITFFHYIRLSWLTQVTCLYISSLVHHPSILAYVLIASQRSVHMIELYIYVYIA